MSPAERKVTEGIQPLHSTIDKMQWRLENQLATELSSVVRDDESLVVALKKDHFKETMKIFRSDPHFEYDYLSFIAGVDSLKTIDLVYNLYSFKHNSWLRVKVSLDRSSPAIETVSDLWSTGDWHERECFDLLGVDFLGHPNLKKILTPDEMEGHPLRKDFDKEVGKLWLVRKIKRLQ